MCREVTVFCLVGAIAFTLSRWLYDMINACVFGTPPCVAT